MDKREKAERARQERARQEDAALRKILYWIVGAVVLEFLLLLVNRFYVNYSAGGLVAGIHTALGVLAILFPICFVLAVIWSVSAGRKEKNPQFPVFFAVLTAALSVCCIIARLFQGRGIRFLYVLVPVATVLALVYYLYQREFLVTAVLCVLGILGVWISPHAASRPVFVYGCLTVLAVILIAAVILSRVLSGRDGTLVLFGKKRQLLSKHANYPLLYVTCAIVAVVVIASLFAGAHVALYGVLAAWLLVSAVYYTVKLM